MRNNTHCVPNVAMNGTRPSFVASKPLIRPHTTPQASAIITASETGRLKSRIISAQMTPHRPTTEPAERSVAPLMRTQLKPIAIRTYSDAECPRERKLESVKNVGVVMAKNSEIPSTTRNGPMLEAIFFIADFTVGVPSKVCSSPFALLILWSTQSAAPPRIRGSTPASPRLCPARLRSSPCRRRVCGRSRRGSPAVRRRS